MEARPFLLWELAKSEARRAKRAGRMGWREVQGVRRAKRTHAGAQPSLFDDPAENWPDRATAVAAPPKLRPFDMKTLLRHEIETLGFLLSRHPLTLYKPILRGRRLVPGKNLHKHVGKRVQTLGWYVTGKLVRTKHDDPMEFMSFEDTTAIYETTFFPRTYEKYCHLFTHLQPYILTGKVEEDFGAVTLTVERVEKI
ncbi:MAG: hypothetical protein D6814_15880 [Calditrichaeota bacterium]|nr:MAG: hypothetical protein D6814_15880 [Calditrichota bacterium]